MNKVGAVDHSPHAKKPGRGRDMIWGKRSSNDLDHGSGLYPPPILKWNPPILSRLHVGNPHHPSSLAHMFAIICFIQVLISNHVKMPK